MEFLWCRKLISVVLELSRAHRKLKLFIGGGIFVIVFHFRGGSLAIISLTVGNFGTTFAFCAFELLLTCGGSRVLYSFNRCCAVFVDKYEVVDYVFKVDCLAGSLPRRQILEGHIRVHILRGQTA